MRRVLVLTAVAVHALLAAYAATTDTAAPAGPALRPVAEQRFTASGSLPPGAEFHLMWEDPVTHGIQALVRVPKNYFIPAHAHTRHESFYVVKGRIKLDFGTKTASLKAGDYILIPAGTIFTLATEGWGGAEFMIALDGAYDSIPAVLPKP